MLGKKSIEEITRKALIYYYTEVAAKKCSAREVSNRMEQAELERKEGLEFRLPRGLSHKALGRSLRLNG